MYDKPRAPHGFNHQSFFRQPVSNLRPIHQLVQNESNHELKPGSNSSPSYPSAEGQPSVSKYANIDKQTYSLMVDPFSRQQNEPRQGAPETFMPSREMYRDNRDQRVPQSGPVMTGPYGSIQRRKIPRPSPFALNGFDSLLIQSRELRPCLRIPLNIECYLDSLV